MANAKTSLPEFPAPKGGRLSAEMRTAFDEAGVIILRGFAGRHACKALQTRTSELVDAFDPQSVRSFFSSKSNVQLGDDYFIRSGADIGFFFEEDAFDAAGDLKQDKRHSINKMGHAMHDIDPLFDEFSRTAELTAVVASLGFADPLLVQSMYIFKPPRIGGEVVCHQDSTYLYTEPETCIGLWFAIDDADEDNGCMQFVPGGHKAPLQRLNYRTAEGALVTDVIDDAPLDDHLAAPAPAERGDLVVFHGRAPHMSAQNRSSRSRHAYTLHIVDGAAQWPAQNWLQRPADFPFRGF